MESKPLAQLLEDMLYEAGDEGLEVCLAESPAESQQDPNALANEYALRYARAVQSITEHRGSRSYSGKRGESFRAWNPTRTTDPIRGAA